MDKFEEGRLAGLEEAAEYHSSEARRLRADAKRYAESDHKPNHELVVPVTRQAENHEYFARNIRSLKSASTPAPASAQDELVKALEEANKRIAKLERLLRPFAAEAHLWGENVPDRYRPLVTEPKQRIPSGGARTAFNIGNCRRAAAALSATGGAK